MKRLLLLAYAALILGTLAIRPLWVDELNQMLGTRASASQLIQWSLTGPGGAPLAYLIQQWFLAALGFSTFAARLPAALFGIAAVALFYKLAQRWQIKYPLIATAIFAFLPMVLRYTQEARPYSQALFFSLLTIYAWPTYPVLLGLACALGLYTQPFTLFPALALLSISLYRRQWTNALALSIAMAAFLPWLYLAHATAAQAHTMDQFFFSWKQVTPAVLLRELTGGTYWTTLPLLALAIAGYRRTATEQRPLLLLWLAFSLAGPILADAAAGYFFASRQLLFALPALVLLAANSLPFWRPWTCALAVALLIASLTRDIRYPFTAKENWATATQAIKSNLTPGACLLVAPMKSLEYYAMFEPSPLNRACTTPLANSTVLAIETPYSTPAQLEDVQRALGSEYKQTNTLSAGGTKIRVMRR